jgi:hypothetical protein
MAERLINLDNSPRTAVTLTLAGESFTIRRVVTGAQQLWSAFVRESAEYLEKIDAYQKAISGKTSPEELARRTEEISREVDVFAETKLDRLLGIIELLLEKNGYSFDRKWWIDNAGEEDYREFITSAMLKDQKGAKKNEAAEES